jgi:microcystin-dependent protein
MSEPFIAEIRIFAGNFAPRNWAFCNGQLLPISQNTALFSLVGTTYGGDGRTTFGVPNLQGRAPMHPGRGPGLTSRRLGQTGGTTTVTLTEAQIPPHRHNARGSSSENDQSTAVNHSWGADEAGDLYRDAEDVTMANNVLLNVGGGQPHTNMQPYLGLYFIIALVGTYPSRG